MLSKSFTYLSKYFSPIKLEFKSLSATLFKRTRGYVWPTFTLNKHFINIDPQTSSTVLFKSESEVAQYVWIFVSPWTVAYQAPAVHQDFPNKVRWIYFSRTWPRVEPRSPALQAGLPSVRHRKALSLNRNQLHSRCQSQLGITGPTLSKHILYS